MSADHRMSRTLRPGTAAEGGARRARRRARRRRPATVVAVVGYVLVTGGSVRLAGGLDRTDLLDGHAGTVLLAASPYLLLVLGTYWALFDHDELPASSDPDPDPDPHEAAAGAPED